MEKTTLQKLLPSLFICIGMIVVGVNSIIKGINAHQTWRIALASVGVVVFAAGIVLILIKIRNSAKASV